MESYPHIEIVDAEKVIDRVRPPISDGEAKDLLKELRVELFDANYTQIDAATIMIIEDRGEARQILNGMREQRLRAQTPTSAAC